MKFDAFISYSHEADKRWAGALRRTLQQVAKPWYRRHGVRVFLDESNATATSRLQSYLREQVRTSKSFVLLASEKSAASPWVADELDTFLEKQTADSLVLVLTSGSIVWSSAAADFDWEKTTALPKLLSRQYSEEPKYLDLRWAAEVTDPPRDARFQDGAAEIVAAILGRGKDEIVGEDLRQHRRTLRIATGAAAVLTLLLVVSIAAGWYATAQRRNAERRFRDVRHLANSFLFEFHDAIDDLPGATPAQHLVVDKALEYLDSLAKEASGNVELLGELGSAYQRVGLLQGGAVASNLGDTAGALASFRKAVEIQHQRIALEGPRPELRSELSFTYELLGDVLKLQGDRDSARKLFLDSLTICEELAAAHPENDRYLERLATVHEKLGDVSILDPRDTKAREHYRRYLQISEQQMARGAGSYTGLHNMGLAYGKWADLLWRDGSHKEARDYYQKQSEYFAKLANLDSQRNAHARRDLALADIDLAEVQAALRDWKGADTYYRSAIAALERLAGDDPKNIQFRTNLVFAHGAYAATLAEQDRAEETELQYLAAIVPLEEIVQLDLGNRGHLWNLSSLYNQYGDFLEEQDRLAEAVAIHRKDVVIIEPLTKGLDDFRSQRELAISYHNLALVLDESNDSSGAIDFYTRSYQVSRTMATKFPADPIVHGDVADSADELVTLHKGDAEKRLQFAREAASSRERAAALSAEGTPAPHRALADAHSTLADLLTTAKQTEAALESRRKAVAAAERSAAIAPADNEIHGEVAFAHTRLARLLDDLGKQAEAVRTFEQAKGWRERACTEPCTDAAARDLMYVLGELATAHASVGRFDESLSVGERALKFQQQFTAGDSDAGVRNALATLFSRYGEALDRSGRYDEAIRAHVSARQQFQRLATVPPVRAGADVEASYAAARAGWAAVKTARLSEADRYFRTSLQEWNGAKVGRPTPTHTVNQARQALVEARLGRRDAVATGCSGVWRTIDGWKLQDGPWRTMRDSGLAFLYCSEALLAAGHGKESLTFAQQAIVMLENARRNAPENVLVTGALGRAWLDLARTQRVSGNPTESCRSLEKGLGLLNPLQAANALTPDESVGLKEGRANVACSSEGK
jgi:tetratricopeptide (TPR) repeat protein